MIPANFNIARPTFKPVIGAERAAIRARISRVKAAREASERLTRAPDVAGPDTSDHQMIGHPCKLAGYRSA